MKKISSFFRVITLCLAFSVIGFGESLEEKAKYVVRIRSETLDIVRNPQVNLYTKELRQHPLQSIRILKEILDNADTEEEVDAASGLIGLIGREPDGNRKARQILIDFLNNEINKNYKSRHSEQNAIYFMGEIGKPQDFDDILGLLEDNNPETRFIILSALKKIGRPEHAEKLLIKMRTLKSKKGKYPDDDEFFEGLDQAVVHLRVKG